VDFEWVSKSGFQAQLEANGYSIRFSRPEKVAGRELDGYDEPVSRVFANQLRLALRRVDLLALL